MVILQSCLQVLRGTETCAASSGDGKQFVFVNVGDDDSVMKWQEDPEPTTSTAIKNDPLVSCVSVCIVCYVHCTDIDCCLSVCIVCYVHCTDIDCCCLCVSFVTTYVHCTDIDCWCLCVSFVTTYVHCTDIDCCLSVHLSLSHIWTGDKVLNISYEVVSVMLYCL